MPVLPALVNLDTARGVVELFPLGVVSAITTIYPDPKDGRRFYAIGFDVKAGKACFYVTGATSTALDPLKAQLQKEVAAMVRETPGMKFGEYSFGNLVVHQPNPPNPGVHDPIEAWKLAVEAVAP